MRHIIFQRSISENLRKRFVSITSAVLQDIFSITEDSDGSERSLTLWKICVCLNLFSGRGVGNFVKKPCHFLKIKSRFIRNNPVCPNQLVPEFIAQSTDYELSPSHVNMSLGHDCYKLYVFSALPANILEKKKTFLLQKCYYLMVLYWSWIMSNLRKSYHGESSVLLFQTSFMIILHMSQEMFFVTFFL